MRMVSIDVNELKDEVKSLQEFIGNKLGVEVKIDGKTMNIGSAEEQPSRGKVKEYVERFLHRRKLTDTYAIRSEKDTFKIVKKKT